LLDQKNRLLISRVDHGFSVVPTHPLFLLVLEKIYKHQSAFSLKERLSFGESQELDSYNMEFWDRLTE
jgi:hypothetical protein